MTTPSLTTLTRTATETAILASARYTELQQSLVDSSDWAELLISPFARPGSPADDEGFLCENDVAALLSVVFNADPQRRTVYLVVDRDNAPRTGNYTVQVDSVTAVTYDASTENPTDTDELLQGIADALNNDGGFSAVAEADAYSMAGDGTLDAVRLRAVVGNNDTTRNTFIVTDNTSFPANAELRLVREIDSASVRVWGRPSTTVQSSVVTGGPLGDMLIAWRPIRDIGVVDLGLTQQINVATQSAIWVELYDVTTQADTYSETVNWVAVYLGVAKASA